MSTGPLLLILLIVLAPTALILSNKMKVKGKLLCYFMCRDLPLDEKLLKVHDDEFVEYQGGQYLVREKTLRLKGYPSGWPGPLQEKVPAALYSVGDGEPRDWMNLTERKLSSREMGAVLDPHWLGMIVKGWQKEAGGGGRFDKMLPWLMIGFGALTLIMTFVLMTKIGALQGSVGG